MSSRKPHRRLIEAILHRASIDASFRCRLLASPDDAIQEAFGARIPAPLRIRFIEKEPGWDEVYVLPDLLDAEDELSPDELDEVAGGQELYRWDATDLD